MTLSEPSFRFHSHIVTTLQEILRRDDDVVRTSCTGPNDVIFRRSDDVELLAGYIDYVTVKSKSGFAQGH